MPVTIYGLASSKDNVIRYIGQTVQPLKKRLHTHTSHARNNYHKNYSSNWVRSVLASGHELVMIPLQHDAIWNVSEMEWIAKYRVEGFNLVNSTEGGGGTLGIKKPPLSEEAKEKIRVAKKGRKLSGPHKKAIGAKMKGRVFTETTRARISEARKGHEVSQETRAKISKSLKGRSLGPTSAATKAKLSEINKGKVMSAESRAKMSSAAKARKRTPEQVDKWKESFRKTLALKKEAMRANNC